MSGPDPPAPAPGDLPAIPSISVPEIRDYGRINPEIVRLLDEGHRQIRIVGVQGQRLLASGLKGAWEATIDVEGSAGPELAADLDAPGLSVICRGSAADGAGRGMRAGRLLIRGDAGDALGYEMSGGVIIVVGQTGHRAGLLQRGGQIFLGGAVGRLAADRQAGGQFFFGKGQTGSHAGHGRTGGEWRRYGESSPDDPFAIALSRFPQMS